MMMTEPDSSAPGDVLPDLIATGTKAWEQLLALATSSQARCGARSPARTFTSLSAAATSPLWDWCLILTEVTFGICVSVTHNGHRGGGCGGDFNVYVRLGVSASLNSVTWIDKPIRCPLPQCDGGMPAQVGAPPAIAYKGAVDIDHVILSTAYQWPPSQSLVDLRTGTGRSLTDGVIDLDRCLEMGGNRRWWMCCTAHFVAADPARLRLSFTVRDLLSDREECSSVPCGFVELPVEGTVWGSGLIFNKTNPDEALVLVEIGSNATIMVVDVAKTPEGNHLHPGVAMSALDGKHLLFFLVSDSIFKFVEGCDYGDGGPIALSTDADSVSQLSSTQLCISKSNTVEIWDCNSNSAEPLRVIERNLSANPGLLHLPVIAESGFLFHQCVKRTGGAQDDCNDELKVTDSLGNVVVTLKGPPGMRQTLAQRSISGFM
ncbi:hypothetical protein Pelo_14893 [Pelomyxa schiedti]|nr:hypothetical protein Pelo_14893 [Pelomyxa schiedti]